MFSHWEMNFLLITETQHGLSEEYHRYRQLAGRRRERRARRRARRRQAEEAPGACRRATSGVRSSLAACEPAGARAP